jgi:predicted O-methyltransferase YrrM
VASSFRSAVFPSGSRRSAVLTRLQLQRLLGWEPEGFRDVWPRLEAIEGWRYRQDLVVLYLLARELPAAGLTLEIGSYKGLGTVALAFGTRDGGHDPVHTVDPHTGDRQALEAAGAALPSSEADLERNLSEAGVADSVVAHTARSDELSTRWDGSQLRFLFVDGWHSYDAVASDLRNWVPLLSPGGAVLVDDYDNYPDVARATDDQRELLPRRCVRAGRMRLYHDGVLPPSLSRYLQVPWG